KALVCLALAEYLSSEEVQMERFNLVGWGPSNLKAQQNEAVQNDPALSALAAQLAYTIPQGQYPDSYWSRATSLGDECVTKNINKDTSDDDLKAMLDTFQKDCESYATAE
ncbi:MAG: sugar ABC transporter substrate-binding protein, partial [Butyrivibrio sp.]